MLGSGLRMDVAERVRMQRAQLFDLALLGVEEVGYAGAGGDDVGQLLERVRVGVRALDGLDVARQRIETGPAGVVEDHGVDLGAARLGGETRLAVWTQKALLVLAVLELGVLPRRLAQLLPGEAAVLERVVPHLLDAVPRPGNVLVLRTKSLHEALSELEEDGIVGLGLADRLDGLVDAADAVRVEAAEAVALLVGGGRKDHVRQGHHGRCHEQVLEHAEVDLLVPLELLLGLRAHRGEEVVGGEVRRMDGHLTALPGLDRRIGREILEADGEHRVTLDADALGSFLLGQKLVIAPGARPVGLLDAPACLTDDVATGDVQIAGDAPQRRHGVRGLLTAGLLVKGDAPLDGGGLGGGVAARDALHVLLGDPGPLAQLVEVHPRDALAYGLETVDPLVAEVLVVELLVADDLEHGHRQRTVTAGAHAQPVLAGLCGDPGEFRVDDRDLHAALHQVGDPVAVEAVGVCVEGLVAPDDAVLGHHVARIVVALWQELRAIHDAGIAQHASHGCDARQVAGVTSKIGHALVGRTAGCVYTGDLVDVAASALAAGDLVSTIFVGDLLEVLDDDVVGLVPGDALELVLTAVLALALHRVEQPVLVIDVIRNAQTAATQTPLIVRVFRIALDLDELAILDIAQDAADVVATRCRTCGTADDGHAILFPFPWNLWSLRCRRWLDADIRFLELPAATAILLAVGLAPVILDHICFRHDSSFSSLARSMSKLRSSRLPL